MIYARRRRGWGGGTGEIDRVTTQREAKQAAAAQTEHSPGGYRLSLAGFHAPLSVSGLGEEGKKGRGSSGSMYVRVHAWMCVEVRGRGGMCAASKKPRSRSVCHGRPIGRRHKQRRYAATARYVPCTFSFLKHIKYTICFPWPPHSGPLLFALPTVSEPTLDAKSWHAFQRPDSWWGGAAIDVKGRPTARPVFVRERPANQINRK